tara:strand:+ start:6493 stop:7506 length:1014 start_codon:yes stop_codon:yes gene_type:complete
MAQARPSALAIQQRFEPGLISIIIPTFDRAHIICDTLISVASQDYPLFEILIVDDGSTDNTAEVVAAWRAKNPGIRLKYVRQKNRGVAAARNHGMRISKGEFFYFLDSDDLVLPRSLSLLIAVLRETDAPYALGEILSTDFEGNILETQYLKRWTASADSVLRNQWLTHAALYRRSAVVTVGFYNEGLRCGEDTEFHWRFAAVNGVGAGVEETIAIRRLHSFSQLSDQDVKEKLSNVISAVRCFQEWALGRNLLRNYDMRVLRWHHRQHGVRLGLAGNWAEKDLSILMIAKLYPGQFIWEGPLGLPKFRLYYAVCLASLKSYYFLGALLGRHRSERQ